MWQPQAMSGNGGSWPVGASLNRCLPTHRKHSNSLNQMGVRVLLFRFPQLPGSVHFANGIPPRERRHV